MAAAMIASEHNLAFYMDLVRKSREHIEAGDFAAWKERMVKQVSSRL
jgi:queuine tRNA-ribosyltransferase